MADADPRVHIDGIEAERDAAREGELATVPLSALELSPDNVRSAEGDDPGLEALIASIRERGVIQPLVVIPTGRKKGKLYAVQAGGRRFRALRALANAREIGENHAVPVVIRSALHGVTEIGLAENVLRAALKPHEEFAAFARLRAEGLDEEAIAAHFGVKRRRVEQLLRLGSLAEPVAKAFAAGEISLQAAEAYASTGDVELQAKAFAANMNADGYLRGHPNHIRSLIRGDSHEQRIKLRAVGLEAYTQAGGRFDADLFGDEGEGRVLDPDILERLHAEKAAEARAELAARMPQVELLDEMPPWNVGEWIQPEREPLTGDKAKAAEDLEAAIVAKREALAALCDEDGNLKDEADLSAAEAIEAEIDGLEETLKALRDTAELTFEPVDGKIVGEVRQDHLGRFVVTQFKHVPADWVPGAEAEPGEEGEGGASTDSAQGEGQSAPMQPWERLKAEHGLSLESVDVMKGHRRRVLQAAMVSARGHTVASAWLVFALCRSVLVTDRYVDPCALGLANRPGIDGSVHAEIEAQPGMRWIADRQAELSADWLGEDDAAKAFVMFLDLSDEEREAWAAIAAGRLLSRSLNWPSMGCAVHDALAREIELDAATVRDFWTPDAAYWARIPKKAKLAALEAIDERLAEVSKKLGKDELTERCVAVFAPDQGLLIKLLPSERVPAAVGRARAWVPEYLAFPAAGEGDAA